MRPRQRDLFGEIPVHLDEVLAWMLAVPGISPDSARFGPYVRDYNVPEKIRQAKASGTFEAAIAAPRPLPARLASYATRSQFSTASPGTLANSRTLSVTTTHPSRRAWPASKPS